jgi:hypothetical protein
MKLPNKFGKMVNVSIGQYMIDWDKTISKPQKRVSDFLRPYWAADCVLSELRIPGSLWRLDIVNATRKIIVEVSPDELHKDYSEFLHKDRAGYLKKLKADGEKLRWAESAGFEYVELDSSDIKNISAELFVEKFGIYL